MLVMYLLVTNLVKYLNGKIFVVLWIGAAALLPVCLLTRWLVLSIYYQQFLPLSLLFFTYLTSLALLSGDRRFKCLGAEQLLRTINNEP